MDASHVFPDNAVPWDLQPTTWNASSSTSGPSHSKETPPSPNRNPQQNNEDPLLKPKVRVSRACTACSKVKLKCDGGQPCSRCKSLEIDECTYLPSMRGKTRKKRARTDNHRHREDTDDAGHTSRGDDSIMRGMQDDPHWRQGKVMMDMKQDFAAWKKDEALTETGPRNSALWSSLSPAVSKNQRSLPNDPNQSVEKLTSLPLPGDAHNPLAVLAEASGQSGRHSPLRRAQHLLAERLVDEDSRETKGFYSPLARSLREDAPHVMSLISVTEAEQLFDTYFKFLHPHLPVLDREHSSPAALAQRNNFLFNSICCVTARSFNVVLWERLREFARFEMERLPKEKNIDVVQGHLIYSVWNIITPSSFEQDKSWIRIGHGIRTAMDINLHRVASVKAARDGLPDWLIRMIIRTWLLAYIIDRTLSAQLGKPTMLRGENSFQAYAELLRNGEGLKSVDDVWVASLAEWTHIMSRVHDVFSSESSDFPVTRQVSSQLPDLTFIFENQFRQLSVKTANTAQEVAHGSTRATDFIEASMMVYENYARLVTYSFSLQKAIESQGPDLPPVFAKYQAAAMRAIDAFESEFEAKGFVRGCPDLVYTTLTFAAVSLLKATQAQFSHLVADRGALLGIARKAADILARTAASPDHLPASQNAFITRLIRVRSTEPAPPPPLIEPMDFQAFGQSIDQDQSKTPWPPAHKQQTSSRANSTGLGDNTFENPYSWLKGLDQDPPVPEAALGVGLGLGNTKQDQDLLFTQDSFWNSILEGSQLNDPTLV